MSFDINDSICDRVLAANGNLTINFYCLILNSFVDSQLAEEKTQFKCTDFLEFYSSYLQTEKPKAGLFERSKYQNYVDYFAHLNAKEDTMNEKLIEQLTDLQNDLCDIILGRVTENNDLMERLLIQLIGHEHEYVRLCSLKYLNCLYDETLWKLEKPQTTEVRVTGEDCIINFTPTIGSTSYYLCLNFPNKFGTAISWHRVPNNATIGQNISFNLGKLSVCGFYDYRIVRLRAKDIENIVHHRIIVHNNFVKQMNMHEIVVDLFRAEINLRTGLMDKRGDLQKV